MTALKKHIVFYLFSALVVSVTVTSCLLSGIYARFVATAVASDDARVAKFDVGTGGGMLETSYAVELDPVTEQTIADAMILTNSSEVSVRCDVTLESVSSLPLVFTWTSGGNTYTAKAGEAAAISFKPSEEQKSFDLEIGWDQSEESKSFLYRRQVDKLILKIDCEQTD